MKSYVLSLITCSFCLFAMEKKPGIRTLKELAFLKVCQYSNQFSKKYYNHSVELADIIDSLYKVEDDLIEYARLITLFNIESRIKTVVDFFVNKIIFELKKGSNTGRIGKHIKNIEEANKLPPNIQSLIWNQYNEYLKKN